MADDYTPTTEEVEAIARVLAAIESCKPGWNFSLVQAIEYRTEKWRRHLYEAEQLLDEMQPFLTGLVAEKRAEWEAEQGKPDPCVMTHTPPFDFAQCETHDETFPLGGSCKWHGKESIAEVLQDEADAQRRRAVRAEHELEMLRAEQGETEWEYGVAMFGDMTDIEHDRKAPWKTPEAATVRIDPSFNDSLVRRRVFAPGLWLPVPDTTNTLNTESTGAGNV